MTQNNSKQLIKLGRREQASKQIEHNWSELDPEKTAITKKTILVFGGNTTDNPEEANGYAKAFESLLIPKLRTNTDILSFFYKTELLQRENGPISNEYIEAMNKIFNDIFKPLLYDNKGYMKEMQGIEKAFRKLVFVGHCGGCNLINITIDNFYNELLKKYPPATANNLIGKIQYIAYNAYEYPSYNTNSLFISPSADPNYSWLKMLDTFQYQSIDTDYPKGIHKEFFKNKYSDRPGQVLKQAFENERAVAFKSGNATYIVPDRMNPEERLGDHSIACITKQKYLDPRNVYAETANLTRNTAKLYLNQFVSDIIPNLKNMFSKTTSMIIESQKGSQPGE